MQIKINVLKKGDTVVNIWDGHLAVKHKDDSVEIFQFYLDENGLPRLAENTVLICQGDGSISTKSDNNSVEISTF